MKIRKATGEEMLALWGCRDEKTTPPTARFFYRNIKSGNAVFWTVDSAAGLIGELYVFFDLEDKDFADGKEAAYLCAFRVREDYRGRGIGTRLMEAALSDLKASGFSRATIGVSEDEPRNAELYRRLGYTEKVKDCHADPCGMDGDMRPIYEEKVWSLLSKTL